MFALDLSLGLFVEHAGWRYDKVSGKGIYMLKVNIDKAYIKCYKTGLSQWWWG